MSGRGPVRSAWLRSLALPLLIFVLGLAARALSSAAQAEPSTSERRSLRIEVRPASPPVSAQLGDPAEELDASDALGTVIAGVPPLPEQGSAAPSWLWGAHEDASVLLHRAPKTSPPRG